MPYFLFASFGTRPIFQEKLAYWGFRLTLEDNAKEETTNERDNLRVYARFNTGAE